MPWDCKVTPAGCACQEGNTTGCIPSNDGLDAVLGTGFPHKRQGFQSFKVSKNSTSASSAFGFLLLASKYDRTAKVAVATFKSQIPTVIPNPGNGLRSF